MEVVRAPPARVESDTEDNNDDAWITVSPRRVTSVETLKLRTTLLKKQNINQFSAGIAGNKSASS